MSLKLSFFFCVISALQLVQAECSLSETGQSVMRDIPASPDQMHLVDRNKVAWNKGESFRASHRPDSFEVALRSPDDAVVLAASSWWMKDRLGNSLPWALAILAAGLAYLENLRRRIQQREKACLATFAARNELQLKRSAVTAERERLALDLHDTLEQTLAAAMFYLCAAKTAKSSTLGQNNLIFLENAIRYSREELRRSIGDLHSSAFHHQTLHEAIEESCSILVQGYEVDFQVLSPSEAVALDTQFAQNLLFLAREAVANALKHARASLIVVTIVQRDAYLEISIEDDGIGFDVSRVHDVDNQRFGIAGMRQRAKRVEGGISFSQREPAGTRVLISAPLQVQSLTHVDDARQTPPHRSNGWPYSEIASQSTHIYHGGGGEDRAV